MTHLRLAAPALLALLLSACAATAPAPVEEPPPADAPPPDMPLPVLPSPEQDTCGASELASFIGGDVSLIDAARFANPVRVIRPGDMVTMDFNPQRLNFELGVIGEIIRVRCG